MLGKVTATSKLEKDLRQEQVVMNRLLENMQQELLQCKERHLKQVEHHMRRALQNAKLQSLFLSEEAEGADKLTGDALGKLLKDLDKPLESSYKLTGAQLKE